MSSNDKAKQVAAAAAGAALAYYGFKKGGVGGNLVGVVATGLATSRIASAAGLGFGPAAPREVRHSIEVAATPEEAFQLWSRLEEFPRFMQNVESVVKTAEGRWRWIEEGPLGQPVEWEVKLTASVPGRRIAWRSTTPEVTNSGEVHFEPTRNGTRVMIVMRYGHAVGPIGAIVRKATRSDPQSAVRESMRRFKELVEARSHQRTPGTPALHPSERIERAV